MLLLERAMPESPVQEPFRYRLVIYDDQGNPVAKYFYFSLEMLFAYLRSEVETNWSTPRYSIHKEGYE